MTAGLQSQGPNDAAANKLGNSTGKQSAPMGPTDALSLGKSGQRSGAIAANTLNPPAMSPQGTAPGAPSAGGPLVGKLKAGFKGRK